jgi:hypothetical protein
MPAGNGNRRFLSERKAFKCILTNRQELALLWIACLNGRFFGRQRRLGQFDMPCDRDAQHESKFSQFCFGFRGQFAPGNFPDPGAYFFNLAFGGRRHP